MSTPVSKRPLLCGRCGLLVKDQPEIQEQMRHLLSVPGIGFITAVTLLGRIGDPGKIKNVRELSAFIGLVPTEKSTGDDIDRGSITSLGNRILRSLLIEAAWSAIRKDSELQSFYFRIKSRHHPKIKSQKSDCCCGTQTDALKSILRFERAKAVHYPLKCFRVH